MKKTVLIWVKAVFGILGGVVSFIFYTLIVRVRVFCLLYRHAVNIGNEDMISMPPTASLKHTLQTLLAA